MRAIKIQNDHWQAMLFYCFDVVNQYLIKQLGYLCSHSTRYAKNVGDYLEDLASSEMTLARVGLAFEDHKRVPPFGFVNCDS